MIERPAADEIWLHVSLAEQRLRRLCGERVLEDYAVSTALRGAGEAFGSERTPRGWHRVRLRIGAGCPPDTVFVARRPSGERYRPALAARHPQRDWILCRILWLTGLEVGRNRGGGVDSLRRFIYIHGCPDSEPMGVPRSHGCIRMRNAELLELFERVPLGCRVLIEEGAFDIPSGSFAKPLKEK
ncbi:L,D-transpeptidase [Thiohalobacter sp. IOR34]|uniref:L,D-transpeptidase n=1 Tax=Thiohalobacter sp. IOR34 TaxID=3057176 RepID=UPI0025B25357|nr:L,D-transpeptidase [Thiohalobacter sp. IOR34]WJW76751.1 L,D-transpeptidase [Thiohalobacter sp. IOR34]